MGRELRSAFLWTRLHTLFFSPSLHAIKVGAAYLRPANPRIMKRYRPCERNTTEDFRTAYALRVGVEGTHAQAIRGQLKKGKFTYAKD
jgi:hypothetical protein